VGSAPQAQLRAVLSLIAGTPLSYSFLASLPRINRIICPFPSVQAGILDNPTATLNL
jgi:hypothetical protein